MKDAEKLAQNYKIEWPVAPKKTKLKPANNPFDRSQVPSAKKVYMYH